VPRRLDHASVARIGPARASHGNLPPYEKPPSDSGENHFWRGRLCRPLPSRFSSRARPSCAARGRAACGRAACGRAAQGCLIWRCVGCPRRCAACRCSHTASLCGAPAWLRVPTARLCLSTPGLRVPAAWLWLSTARLWLSTARPWLSTARLWLSTAVLASGRDGCVRPPYSRRILHASLAWWRRRISQ
jgi:hypothetical protein